MTDALLEDVAKTLEQAHLDDLASAATRVEIAVRDWWQTVMQWSFTDHGTEHSRRVADYADQLASVAPVSGDTALNPVERFVLLTAAWVHDIGMQNRSESDTREKVRVEHPRRSHNLILGIEEGFDFPSEDGSVRDAVATVALAHGTDYYATTIANTNAVITVRGFTVRVAMLAALLLMADELDLHHGRAIPGQVKTQLESLTRAHWLKHQCVTDVRISVERSQVQITVALAFPSGLDTHGAIAIQTWIAAKLQKQMALVDGELLIGFDGRFVFNPKISFEKRFLSGQNPNVRPEVLSIIKADNARSQLINHVGPLASGRDAIDSDANVIVTGTGNGNGRESDGRDDLVRALAAHARSTGKIVAEAPRWEQGTIPVASDVLRAWMSDLQIDIPVELDQAQEGIQREALLVRLEGGLRSGSGRVLLVAAGWDQLAEGSLEWIGRLVFPRLSQLGHVGFMLSATRPTAPGALDETWTEVEVGRTDPEALRGFVRSRIGRRAEDLIDVWTTYAAAKQLEFTSTAESTIL